MRRLTPPLSGTVSHASVARSQGSVTLCQGMLAVVLVVAIALSVAVEGKAQTLADINLQEGYVQAADDVKIHFVTAGEGPLLVMVHGFPDFWYTWRNQMPALSQHFKVVAIDQRGYNRSSQPDGVDRYAITELVNDLRAVVDFFESEQAVIVGHDWGGFVAWTFAMQHPRRVSRLVILNLPHPRGLMRELANNPEQQASSQYARDYQKEDAASKITPERLAAWVKDPRDRELYVQAFRRSSIEGMLNYYKASYPKPSSRAGSSPSYPQIQCPVLMFHGLDDKALLPAALNGTWNWIDNELTLVTVPKAGHFIQHDAAQLVTERMLNWLRPVRLEGAPDQ